jgi:sirohydrochlorin ferrochelatase
VLAAHGSTDRRFADVIEALAALTRGLRPSLEVRIGYLEHGPGLATVSDSGCVVVPALLTSGFHVRSDIPARAEGAVIARPVGPDRRLTSLLVRRLADAGWQRERPLVLVAAGSADPRALADVHQTARDLGDEVGMEVPATFLGNGEPRFVDVEARAVASYLLAPGHFSDTVERHGAEIVAAPLGADESIAEIILDRYDAAR